MPSSDNMVNVKHLHYSISNMVMYVLFLSGFVQVCTEVSVTHI